MKRLSRRKMRMEINSMYNLVAGLLDAERFKASEAGEDYGSSGHDLKAECFELIRNYMIEHFRPLV